MLDTGCPISSAPWSVSKVNEVETGPSLGQVHIVQMPAFFNGGGEYDFFFGSFGVLQFYFPTLTG